MKKTLFGLFIALLVLGFDDANAHCQVPCGIYDDHLRIHMMEENILLIEKAMNEINTLSKGKDKNMNQLVRFVNEKEKHAQGIQDIATQYFLTQRIQSNWSEAQVNESLKLVHALVQGAMKAKQTTELVHVDALRKTLKSFEKLYFEITAKK